MWPFENSEKSKVAETPESDPRDGSDARIVEVEKTRSERYTEHTAIAEFSDGTEKEYVFDVMKRDGSCIVLGDYVDVVGNDCNLTHGQYTRHDFVTEKNLTIPFSNLKTFETVNREEKEMEYTVTVEKPKDAVENE